MYLRVLCVACVLLLTVTQISGTCICYQPGADCKDWNNKPCNPNGGGGWLQAMLQSKAREQGNLGEAWMQIDDKYCDCCCTTVPCSATVCGNPAVCPINLCYKRVLGEEGCCLADVCLYGILKIMYAFFYSELPMATYYKQQVDQW